MLWSLLSIYYLLELGKSFHTYTLKPRKTLKKLTSAFKWLTGFTELKQEIFKYKQGKDGWYRKVVFIFHLFIPTFLLDDRNEN